MRPIRRIVMLLPLLLVAGCSTMKPSDFAGSEPRLDLFAYFEGKTRAWGIFEGRSGELKRQFTVDMAATDRVEMQSEIAQNCPRLSGPV